MREKIHIKKILSDKRFIGGMFLAISVVFVTLSITALINAGIKSSRDIRATAVVIDYFIEAGEDESGAEITVYYPVVEFKDQAGNTVRALSETAKSYREYSAGEKINIIYNPQDPTNFEVVSIRSEIIFPVILIMVAIAVGAFGVMNIHGYLQDRKIAVEE